MRTNCLRKTIAQFGCGLLIGLPQPAQAESTTFEDPLVSGEAISLPVWSGFSPVVLQYGEGFVQDAVAGAGMQALEMAAGSGVSWSSKEELLPEARAENSFLLRHESFSTATPEIPPEELSAVLFINKMGLMALNGNTRGGGTWQTLQPLAVEIFYEIRILRDYSAQTYDVEVDGALVADDFGFKDLILESSYLATFESSERVWLDDLSADIESERNPPIPNPMSWATVPTPGTPEAGGVEILSTDFTGRMVSGNTAGNIAWTINGVSEPGNLTAVDVNSGGLLSGLFTTADATDRFIPNLNIGNEGPWSTTITLNLTDAPFALRDLVLDFQHLGNTGTVPIVNKRGRFNVSVTGSVSGLLDTVSLSHAVLAGNGAGRSIFEFSPPLFLDNRETYDVVILAEGAGDNANVGLDSVILRKTSEAVVDAGTSIRMIATTATDPSGVAYFFECLSGGGHDSGWQDSPEYIDTGLSPGTRYTYRTRARDKSLSQNTTGWSAAATATTNGSPPPSSFAAWVASSGLAPEDQDFEDDPDGDGLPNGVEAWFGTAPNVFSIGLDAIMSDGVTTTFTHPRAANPPSNVTGYYEWSINLIDWYTGDGVDGPPGGQTATFMVNTVGTTTMVTATVDSLSTPLFVRAGAMQK